MPSPAQNERQLSRIIVYGFSLAFGLVVASLEALKPAPAGFAIELSWRTLLAFVVGTLIVLPCFQVIVYSERKSLRRSALALIIVLGLGAFFYPMRVVPADKWRAVFTGLAVAILALSVMATLLLLLHRFFERDEKERQG
jgi:hypothetical protein